MRLPIPAEKLLRPGATLEILVPVRPEPKYKFCVFCAVDDPPLYFFINSEINAYIRARKDLLEQQIVIPPSELDERLHKESYLDCSQAFSNFSHADVCGFIDANRGCYMGKLSDAVLAQIVESVSESLTIRPIERDAILSGIGG